MKGQGRGLGLQHGIACLSMVGDRVGGQGLGVVGLVRGAGTNTLSEKIDRLTGRKYFLSTTPLENNNE